ncbi:hypothetical protein DL98DRAFT_655657, partial [Cadophora sp. DSE1049]
MMIRSRPSKGVITAFKIKTATRPISTRSTRSQNKGFRPIQLTGRHIFNPGLDFATEGTITSFGDHPSRNRTDVPNENAKPAETFGALQIYRGSRPDQQERRSFRSRNYQRTCSDYSDHLGVSNSGWRSVQLGNGDRDGSRTPQGVTEETPVLPAGSENSEASAKSRQFQISRAQSGVPSQKGIQPAGIHPDQEELDVSRDDKTLLAKTDIKDAGALGHLTPSSSRKRSDPPGKQTPSSGNSEEIVEDHKRLNLDKVDVKNQSQDQEANKSATASKSTAPTAKKRFIDVSLQLSASSAELLASLSNKALSHSPCSPEAVQPERVSRLSLFNQLPGTPENVALCKEAPSFLAEQHDTCTIMIEKPFSKERSRGTYMVAYSIISPVAAGLHGAFKLKCQPQSKADGHWTQNARRKEKVWKAKVVLCWQATKEGADVVLARAKVAMEEMDEKGCGFLTVQATGICYRVRSKASTAISDKSKAELIQFPFLAKVLTSPKQPDSPTDKPLSSIDRQEQDDVFRSIRMGEILPVGAKIAALADPPLSPGSHAFSLTILVDD